MPKSLSRTYTKITIEFDLLKEKALKKHKTKRKRESSSEQLNLAIAIC